MYTPTNSTSQLLGPSQRLAPLLKCSPKMKLVDFRSYWRNFDMSRPVGLFWINLATTHQLHLVAAPVSRYYCRRRSPRRRFFLTDDVGVSKITAETARRGALSAWRTLGLLLHVFQNSVGLFQKILEYMGQCRDVMVALPNIGGALCSTLQSLADAHYWSAVH